MLPSSESLWAPQSGEAVDGGDVCSSWEGGAAGTVGSAAGLRTREVNVMVVLFRRRREYRRWAVSVGLNVSVSVSIAVISNEGAIGVVKRDRLISPWFRSPAEPEESAGASLELGRLSAAADAIATVAAMAAAAAGSLPPTYFGNTLGWLRSTGSGNTGVKLVPTQARFALWDASVSEVSKTGVTSDGGNSGGTEEPAAKLVVGWVVLARWERGSVWPGQSECQALRRD